MGLVRVLTRSTFWVVLAALWTGHVFFTAMSTTENRIRIVVLHRRLPDPRTGCDRRLLTLMHDLEQSNAFVEYISMEPNKMNLSDEASRHCKSTIYTQKHRSIFVEIDQDQVSQLHAIANEGGGGISNVSYHVLPSSKFTKGLTTPYLKHCHSMQQLTNAVVDLQPHIILFPVWFWGYDLKSLAWQIAPTIAKLRENTRLNTSPFLVALADDVYSERAMILAQNEPNQTEKERFDDLVNVVRSAEAQIYQYADAIAFISERDRASAEKALTSFDGLRLLLRPTLSFKPNFLSSESGEEFADRTGLLFVGHGSVETNYQGISWFLSDCWPTLRTQLPNISLTIVGKDPSLFTVCTKRGAHCGWSVGTQYYGNEPENGIFVKGYLSSSELRRALRRARVFVVPIVGSTGINTKVFNAFEARVPAVISVPAAGGIADKGADGFLVVVPAEAKSFSDAIVNLYTNSTQWAFARHQQDLYVNTLMEDQVGLNDARNFVNHIQRNS